MGVLNEQFAAVERAKRAAEERLEAARALRRACLREAYDNDNATNWERRNLGSVADVRSGIQKTPGRKPVNSPRPYLTVRNVQKGFISFEHVEEFEVTPAEVASYKLLDGDLLIVEGNGSRLEIGRNAVFRSDGREWVHQNHLIRVRLHRDVCCPQFVSRYLNSEAGTAQMLEKAQTTSGLYTLSSGKVASLQVPIPSLDEQLRIVSLLELQIEDAKKVEEASGAQLAQSEAILSVLLRRAFSGGI